MLLAGVTLASTVISLFMFYETLMRQHATYLANQVSEQLNWLEMIGHANQGDAQKTLDQYVQYGGKHHLLGKSGEFMLAVREGESIRFLLARDSSAANIRLPMTDDPHGDPMQCAMAGNVGTMIGLDYRGHRVLAAFAPVPHFKWGIVAKIELWEVLAPFVRSASIIAGTVLILIMGGVLLVVLLGRPLIKELEQSRERLTLVIQGTRNGIGTGRTFMRTPCGGRPSSTS